MLGFNRDKFGIDKMLVEEQKELEKDPNYDAMIDKQSTMAKGLIRAWVETSEKFYKENDLDPDEAEGLTTLVYSQVMMLKFTLGNFYEMNGSTKNPESADALIDKMIEVAYAQLKDAKKEYGKR